MMMRPPRPEARRSISNPFQDVLNENHKLISDVDDEDDDDDDDDDERSVASQQQQQRHKPPRPSLLLKPSSGLNRRRRRSSGRFLNLDRQSSSGGSVALSDSNLSELYQKAVKLNAENKINVSNSWNLNLIENIDRVLLMVEKNDEEDRVNFTKASCTLDASVKIYSYRVDDVHLTSYKVLANLNRNDSSNHNKKKKQTTTATDDAGDDETADATPSQSTEKQSRGSTLETHVANINTNKLDAAFDIDPLFHKMSKTFDEGGAKGLLLVNLGVSDSGCNIVFDSSEQEDAPADQEPHSNESAWVRIDEGMVDIGTLTQKLDSLLSDHNATIRELPLVPQLSSLRAEHEDLIRGGFCDGNALLATVGPKTPGKRKYHANDSEEKQAEDTIHKEAMERSLNVSATQNLSTRFGDDSPESANDQYDSFVDFNTGGYDDGDDDDEDVGFNNFIANARFSEESGSTPTVATSNPTSNLIDAIATGQTQLSTNDYEFLPNNAWAGAAHWKRTTKKKKAAAMKPKKKKATKKEKLVNLRERPDVASVLKKSKKATQLSKAMIQKYTAEDNKLPVDAGLGPSELTKLFLRPVNVEKENEVQAPKKTVDFNLGGIEYDDGSFGGGDDDGGGFNFGGGGDQDDDESHDDFAISELEGIRKVEKVRVGYAMVAKKVDVKKLKAELWTELEAHLVVDSHHDVEEEEDAAAETTTDNDKAQKPTAAVSFQDTVHDMEAKKSQLDVTLPFYFICLLHLANEKNLRLESRGLQDFLIYYDQD